MVLVYIDGVVVSPVGEHGTDLSWHLSVHHVQGDIVLEPPTAGLYVTQLSLPSSVRESQLFSSPPAPEEYPQSDSTWHLLPHHLHSLNPVEAEPIVTVLHVDAG